MHRYFSLEKVNTCLFLLSVFLFCGWALIYSELPDGIVTVVGFGLAAMVFAIPRIKNEFLSSPLTPFAMILLSIFFVFLLVNRISIFDIKDPPPIPTPDMTATTSYELTRLWTTALARPTATSTPTPNLTATTSYELTRIWSQIAQTPTITTTVTPTMDGTRTFENALTQAWLAATPDATAIFAAALTRAWELQLTATPQPD